jgi:hypothetical protein
VDIRSAYGAGANAFVGKSYVLEEYEEKIDAIDRFWLSVAELPTATPAATQ